MTVPVELPVSPADAFDRYAVLGNPVTHSQSPFIHGEFARQTGQRVVYGRLHCELDDFEAAVRRFAAEGGRGCNVTVPFKFQAPTLAQVVSPRASLAQAANVLGFDDGRWWADNTDGVGLVRDIESHAGVALAGTRVLLIGAGGAAAGVLGPLIEARPAEVVVVNRSADKAAALADRHAALAATANVALADRAITAPGRGFDVIINATASSLQGAPVPVPTSVLRPGALAVDLMYGSAAAPFLGWAREAGAHARDGLGMLVEQAAEAFLLWRGVRPAAAPVLHALRERLLLGTA